MPIYLPASGITIPDGHYSVPGGSYEGVVLTQIPTGLLQLKDSAVCYVSGSGPNVFGHALFMISPSIGYVHAAQPGTHPVRFLPHDEYQRYLNVMGKISWKMFPADIPNPNAAANYIQTCLLTGYNWQPMHNCLTFCNAILSAAGAGALPNSNVFPSTATQQAGAIPTPPAKHPWDSIGNKDL